MQMRDTGSSSESNSVSPASSQVASTIDAAFWNSRGHIGRMHVTHPKQCYGQGNVSSQSLVANAMNAHVSPLWQFPASKTPKKTWLDGWVSGTATQEDF